MLLDSILLLGVRRQHTLVFLNTPPMLFLHTVWRCVCACGGEAGRRRLMDDGIGRQGREGGGRTEKKIPSSSSHQKPLGTPISTSIEMIRKQ